MTFKQKMKSRNRAMRKLANRLQDHLEAASAWLSKVRKSK